MHALNAVSLTISSPQVDDARLAIRRDRRMTWRWLNRPSEEQRRHIDENRGKMAVIERLLAANGGPAQIAPRHGRRLLAAASIETGAPSLSLGTLA